MSLSDYAGLKQAVADWLNRADLTDNIPDFITLAESTLNTIIRDTRMVETATISVGAGVRKGAVPSDMLEPLFVTLASDEDYPLEQVSIEQLIMLRRARTRTAGPPRFYTVVGRSIEVTPTPAISSSFGMDYYQAIPTLSVGNPTNWLLTNQPHLYLYTALLHAAPFLKDDARTELFGNLLAQQVQALIKQNATTSLSDLKTSGFSLAGGPPAAPTNQVGA